MRRKGRDWWVCLGVLGSRASEHSLVVIHGGLKTAKARIHHSMIAN